MNLAPVKYEFYAKAEYVAKCENYPVEGAHSGSLISTM